ncbi:MAG: preQ(1) synthase [Halanaerobiales bacterium]
MDSRDNEKHDNLTVLGNEVREPIDQVEWFKAPEDMDWVKFETDELLSNCPVTGQPDKYDLKLIYLPHERCIESKSLKLYLWKFRDESHFCEELAHIIVSEIFTVCKPKKVIVRLDQNRRGGLDLSAQASKSLPAYEDIYPEE